jgi:hypothetical protein
MTAQLNGGLTVLAAMATPAVLLLATAMLILSTNQRLQAIFERVRETELTITGGSAISATTDLSALNDLLIGHARRARSAQRALLCLYGSAGLFVAVVVSVGLASLDIGGALAVALVTAFLGSALLLCGAILLISETLIGIRATDQRLQSVMSLCRELESRSTGSDRDR